MFLGDFFLMCELNKLLYKHVCDCYTAKSLNNIHILKCFHFVLSHIIACRLTGKIFLNWNMQTEEWCEMYQTNIDEDHID